MIITRYLPTISTAAGIPLPRSHPVAQADFLRQHMRAGWSEGQALVRYRAWERGEIEATPIIPEIRRIAIRGIRGAGAAPTSTRECTKP
ncbi:MAG: hypothetical protein L0H83_10080 [Salinisphaera sp.]|nr:hypothetical protein [Salinisphaera sp.]